MAVFSYPIIGNWMSTQAHHTAIQKHEAALEQMTDDEKNNLREQAATYNEKINETATPLTDPFSDQGEDQTVASGYFNMLNVGESMGSLEIPSIDVNLPIYHGVSNDVLEQGIGHMSNSSLPIGGDGSHAALTAHRGLPSAKLFRDLDKVGENEHFYIHTLDETLAYKVDDIQVVLPSETNWLEMEEDEDYVTLITCEPYMINTHRLLVRGKRVPMEEQVASFASDQSTDIGSSSNAQPISEWSLVIIGVIALVLIILFFTYRKRKRLKEGL